MIKLKNYGINFSAINARMILKILQKFQMIFFAYLGGVNPSFCGVYFLIRKVVSLLIVLIT